MNRHSAARKTSPPPYFRNVQLVPQKDYMTENYRRMKDIAKEGQMRKMQTVGGHGHLRPLKAQFIPGVTKNPKYAHVQSRFRCVNGGPTSSSIPMLHPDGAAMFPSSSSVDELALRRLQQSQKFTHPAHSSISSILPSQTQQRMGNSRLTRSSVDLRGGGVSQFEGRGQQQQRKGSISAFQTNPRQAFRSRDSLNLTNHVNNPVQADVECSHNPVNAPGFQFYQHPVDNEESVYKWKFNEQEDSSSPVIFRTEAAEVPTSTPLPPPPQVHRIEYLPCDGICKEETVNEPQNSARSTSSRTSRGCNTEETRIFPEAQAQRTIMQQQQQPYQCRGLTLGVSNENLLHQSAQQYHQNQRRGRGDQLCNNNNNGHPLDFPRDESGDGHHRSEKRHYAQQTTEVKQNVNSRAPSMKRMMTNGNGYGGGDADDVASRMSQLSVHSRRSNATSPKGGADLPHALGSMPKYLKQRKEEWRADAEAKQRAEDTADIPPGFKQLSEDERHKGLVQCRKEYEMLIGELNRIPIRMDTMRVRNHKVDLEKRLNKLEETMKIFSRPNVWIKVNQ